MAEARLARLFRNGRSQAVRRPHEFRFAGDRVRARRMGRGVLLEPLATDVTECIAVINGSPQQVRLRLEQAVKRGEDVAVPAVAAFELWYGAATSARREADVRRLESFFAGPLKAPPLRARGRQGGRRDPGGSAPSWSRPTPRSWPVWMVSTGRTGPRPADAARQGCGVVSTTTWMPSRPASERRSR